MDNREEGGTIGERFNPIDHPICLALPHRMTASAWIQHVPLGMLLVDLVRPTTLVELGVFSGVSYCSFCQAVRELGLDTRCYGIDTWAGDPQATFYGPQILDELKAYHDRRYDSFSQLIQSTFDQALRFFPDGSIDLLHIDGFHSYEAAQHDFQSWLPKMGNRGVVVVHDIATMWEGYGVWKLWQELKPQYPHFEFAHEFGLGVLAVGTDLSAPLRALLEASPSDAGRIREFFSRLGRGIRAEYEREALAGQLASETASREEAMDALQARYANVAQTAHNLRNQLNAGVASLNQLTEQLRSHEETLATLHEELARTQQYAESLRRELSNRDQAVQTIQAAAAAEADRLRHRLWLIEHRLSFQLLEAGWRTQSRVVPPETRRGRFWTELTGAVKRLAAPPTVSASPAVSTPPMDEPPQPHLGPPPPVPPPATEATGSTHASLVDVPGETTEDRPESASPGSTSASSNEAGQAWPAMPRLRPVQSNADAVALYTDWFHWSTRFRRDRTAARDHIATFARHPVISLIMPVYNTAPEFLTGALEAICEQYYPYWELCICDDASHRPHVATMLREYASRDRRIKLVFSERNMGIAEASNRALDLATGDFIGLVDHDDPMTPDALYEVAAALQETDADYIYSDQDKIDAEGRYEPALLKPAWSPDLLLTFKYTFHLDVYRKHIIDRIGGFRSELSEGAHDVDLALRFTERTGKVLHIPRVLYHWALSSTSTSSGSHRKPAAYAAVPGIETDTLRRRGIQAALTPDSPLPGFCEVRRAITRPGAVSIIIPTHNGGGALSRCIRSIEEHARDVPHEVIIVDAGSRDAETLALLLNTSHQVVHLDGPFEHSRLLNAGAQNASGEYLLLLHDDIEAFSSDWLPALIEHAQRSEVGAVGGKLLDSDSRPQHMGIVLPVGPIGAEFGGAVQKTNEGHTAAVGLFMYPDLVRNYSAVSAACLMIRRDLFLSIGGLDEEHVPLHFGDVDLCLRLREEGYRIIYTPHAVIRHHGPLRFPRDPLCSETAYMKTRWTTTWFDDPYFHPSFDRRGTFDIDYSRPDTMAWMDEQWERDINVGDITAGRVVGQDFLAERDDLCGVNLFFDTNERACGGLVRFHLRGSAAADDLVRLEVDAARIHDRQYFLFAFDAIPGSAGKRFSCWIEFEPATAEDHLTIWRSAETHPVHGPWQDNHHAQAGTLSFQLLNSAPQYRYVACRDPQPAGNPQDQGVSAPPAS